MFAILFIVTAALVVFMGRSKTGNMYNPLFFYILFWCLWAFVSLMNPYLLYAVSDKTYLVIWINVVSFSVGFLLVSRRFQPSQHQNVMLVGYEFTRTKLFLAVQIVVFFLLFNYYRKFESVLGSLASEDARRIVFEQGLLFKNPIEVMLYYWFVAALVYGSLALVISNLVMNGQRNTALFVALGNCFLFGQIGQGRFVYYHLIMFFIISIGFKYDLHKKLHFNIRKEIKKRWGLYIALLALAVYLMNRTSARRMGESLSFADSVNVFIETSFKQFVVYFTGPFRALDWFLTSNVTERTGYTLGRSLFSGIDQMIGTIAAFLDIPYLMANQITTTFTVDNIYIGSGGQAFNAFYTSIMNFYLDGGMPMVIILSCLYGVVSGLLFNYYRRNTNLFTFTLLVYTTYQMVATEFRWNYSAPSTLVVVAALIWVDRRYRRRLKLNDRQTPKIKKIA